MDSNGRWVCLDVGETLIDETRIFQVWAEVLSVPQFTLMGVLGGSISNAERPEDWRRFFELLQQPEWRDHQPKVEDRYGGFRTDDLYPDALPAIRALKEAGYRLAITPDRLLGRMTATMRFLTVAMAPFGSLVGGAGAPLAGPVGLRRGASPGVLQRVDHLPALLDLGRVREQGAVADQHVQDQPRPLALHISVI